MNNVELLKVVTTTFETYDLPGGARVSLGTNGRLEVDYVFLEKEPIATMRQVVEALGAREDVVRISQSQYIILETYREVEGVEVFFRAQYCSDPDNVERLYQEVIS